MIGLEPIGSFALRTLSFRGHRPDPIAQRLRRLLVVHLGRVKHSEPCGELPVEGYMVFGFNGLGEG